MKIYCDGSSRNNQNINKSVGSFGVIVLSDDDKVIDMFKSENFNGATNNQMEMKAILWALNKYGDKNNPPDLFTDSSYAYNTFNEWIWGWQRNGWKNSSKKTPENMDLILEYVSLYEQGKRANFHHIRGHSGNRWNEAADALAVGDKNKLLKYLGIL